jgi:hypothetical protein
MGVYALLAARGRLTVQMTTVQMTTVQMTTVQMIHLFIFAPCRKGQGGGPWLLATPLLAMPA